jgi:DNA-binding transcriptional regulator YhcF (GntR family)
MNASDELNNTMLKKYITKHYKLYKIHPLFPISNKLSKDIQYSILDYERNEDTSMYSLDRFLCKVFNVDAMAVKNAMKELLDEEVLRLQRQQFNLFKEHIG